MRTHLFSRSVCGRALSLLVMGLWLSAPEPARAQSSEDASSSSGRVPRLRLFRIAPGFLSDPIALQEDDNGMADILGLPSGGLSSAPTMPGDDGPDWLQFGMGSDNPYLDLRRPGDPGGVGFYRVNTQVQLLDSPTTSCSLGFQTVTPAGIQYAGAPDGATVVSPAFSVFHALGDRAALQGFVGKNIAVSNAEEGHVLQRNVQCGLAVQRPLFTDGPDNERGLFLSVGAMGQVRPDHDNFHLLPTCDVLPGLHWHVNDNWWVSSALLVPVGPVHTAPGQWQLTCWFQF